MTTASKDPGLLEGDFDPLDCHGMELLLASSDPCRKVRQLVQTLQLLLWRRLDAQLQVLAGVDPCRCGVWIRENGHDHIGANVRAKQPKCHFVQKAVDVYCIFSFMVIERMRGPLEQVKQPLIGAMSFVGHRIAHRRGAHKLVSLPTVMSRVGHTPVSAVFSTNFQNETVSNVTAKGNLW